MTQTPTRLESLEAQILARFGEQASLTNALGELTLEVPADRWLEACTALRDAPELSFEQCIDLCGVDYLAWGQPLRQHQPSPFPRRFAIVVHLMSVRYNWRLRVRTWVESEDFPVLPSLIDVWPAVNWFEREAFDMYGVVFEGHPDLRRILTDYGFIGYPFRKDFPLSGNVEMRFDPEQKRVVYQPVTIEPREITPRIVREEGYGTGR